MAVRRRTKQYDRVSDYVTSQVQQLSENYKRYRLVFIAIFVFISVTNVAVACLAITAMVRVIDHDRFDAVGIVTLTSSVTAVVNLGLLSFNAVTRYVYRRRQYADAYRSLRAAYASYIYGMGRYEENGFSVFQQDVNNIIGSVTRPKVNVFRALVRNISDLEDD